MIALLDKPRRMISDALFMRAIRRHRSRLGWRDAPRYSTYWEKCRVSAQLPADPDPEAVRAAQVFQRDGVTSLWNEETGAIARTITERIKAREAAGETVWNENPNKTGASQYGGNVWLDFPELEDVFRGILGDFLQLYFGSPYKIWFALLYRSEHRNDQRMGSQRWHSDSGPGSCVNVMYYLDETEPCHGPLEVLPWEQCLKLFASEERVHGGTSADQYDRFGALYDHYEREIKRSFKSEVRQPMGPEGLLVPFLNNTIHRGGYPHEGHRRTAMVFHCYPADRPVPFALYREAGVVKRGSYPMDPAEPF
jgi:hypothetical protein